MKSKRSNVKKRNQGTGDEVNVWQQKVRLAEEHESKNQIGFDDANDKCKVK